ncbi:MAG: GGDEF domain-containing protein, partial [Acidobacteria bacterium]|nr:GGDEF domain-containing protein [Acidobacteriota bacterium]
MLRPEQITAAGLFTAAGASLILSAILRLLDRLYRREYLSWWAWSWMAMCLHFVLGSTSLLLRPNAQYHAVPLVAASLALAAGLCQAACLLLGVLEIAHSRRLHARQEKALIWGLVGAGAGLSILALTTANSPWSQDFILESFRSLVMGGVFIISALALWRLTPWNHGIGRRLVCLAFLVYGLHQYQYFGVALASLVRRSFVNYSIYIGFIDVILQFIVGLGIVIWFLEEEREGVVLASRQIEHLAYHDSLTALPNRKLFLDRL